MQLSRRIWYLLGLAGLAVPLSAAALAHACTGLATVSSNPSAARAGETITVIGKYFAAHDPTDARTEPAKVRFDSPSGPVVGTASPSSARDSGSFSAQITVPELGAGDHVLIVTQNGTDGRPAYGTPARQAFTVLPPLPPVAPAAPAVDVPALAQPLVAPTVTRAVGSLTRAIRSCRRRYRVSAARTLTGKRRMARRRAACIRAARARLS
jgi:hypothetical protein